MIIEVARDIIRTIAIVNFDLYQFISAKLLKATHIASGNELNNKHYQTAVTSHQRSTGVYEGGSNQ